MKARHKKSFYVFLSLIAASLASCTSRGYNDANAKSVFPVVPKGEYYLEKVSFPGEDFVYAAQRISPSATQGLTSYGTRGWLTCSTGISGQASCSIKIGRNDAMLANSSEVMSTVRRRLPAAKKPTGESVFEWKVSVPFEARMQTSSGEENTYAVDFGSSDLGDGEEASQTPKKQNENVFIANAVLGLRVEPATIIPVMERLKTKAKIPKGQGFLETDVICTAEKVCSLTANENGAADGALVSEVIPQSEGLIKGIEKEWTSYSDGSEKNAKVIFQGRMRLFQEVEQTAVPPVGDKTAADKAAADKAKAKLPAPRRNTVALATFYKVEFLD